MTKARFDDTINIRIFSGRFVFLRADALIWRKCVILAKRVKKTLAIDDKIDKPRSFYRDAFVFDVFAFATSTTVINLTNNGDFY